MSGGIGSEQELEEVLSRPYPEDVEAARALGGDVLILGAGGKMGPSLARRAARAIKAAGVKHRVIAASRFSDAAVREGLEREGIETVAADLLDPVRLGSLPWAKNVIFMAARKFGSTGNEPLTWAMNAWLPAQVAQRYRHSRIVAFASGNVYPLVDVRGGGADEGTAPGPVGEYAQSVLARERMFEYFSGQFGTPVVLLRLNYAVELRYGVLVDVGRKVWERQPVDVTMGYVNVIWQGDANSVCLRSFGLCGSPPAVLNVTGAETLAVREIAAAFGRRFGVEPAIEGEEAPTALLNNAGRCHERFGQPRVRVEEMIDWIAEWIRGGGRLLEKPTHFEVRDGRF